MRGLTAGSVALTGWALGIAVEGLASVIVVWRFTGSRALSQTAECCAQRAVAVSFWLLASYSPPNQCVTFITGHHPGGDRDRDGADRAVVLAAMPLLGRAKHTLAARLDTATTAEEGTQNYLCAAQAAAVLLGLAVTAAWAAASWLDPAIGLGIAAVAAREGTGSRRGDDCC